MGDTQQREISGLRLECADQRVQIKQIQDHSATRERTYNVLTAALDLTKKRLAMTQQAFNDAITTVDHYWSFDEHQMHTHSWHSKQDCLGLLRALAKDINAET